MTDSGRDAFSRYRERLDALGFRPSRRLGQNFLLEPALHREVLRAAAVEPGDTALEIGAGLGFLTRELAAVAERTVAVEIDRRLQQILAEDRPTWPCGDTVTIVHGDALESGQLAPVVVEALAGVDRRRLCVAANLPYKVSGPCVAALSTSPLGVPSRIGLLVQREFADRLCAKPGDEAFSGPTALVRTAFEAKFIRKVGGSVFRPRPNVDSAIVALRAREESGFVQASHEQRDEFARFVRAVHAQRRKRFARGVERASEALGRPFTAPAELLDQRPEDIDGPMLWEVFTHGL